MADYSVVFARSARKELQNLDPQVARRIRVGEWRVVYRISDRDRLVDVIAVRHRRDAYR